MSIGVHAMMPRTPFPSNGGRREVHFNPPIQPCDRDQYQLGIGGVKLNRVQVVELHGFALVGHFGNGAFQSTRFQIDDPNAALVMKNEQTKFASTDKIIRLNARLVEGMGLVAPQQWPQTPKANESGQRFAHFFKNFSRSNGRLLAAVAGAAITAPLFGFGNEHNGQVGSQAFRLLKIGLQTQLRNGRLIEIGHLL